MQLELYFKKEYVCKIPSRRLKQFRHILRKYNELAHLLHQVTYVIASDIKNFATNLQIYDSFYISKQMPNNETYSSIANIFLLFYFSFNTKLFTLKLGRGRAVNCLFQKKIFKIGKQTLIFLLVSCIS